MHPPCHSAVYHVPQQNYLVTNIPNELVLRSIEHIVKRYCEVSNTQASPKMPACAADIVDDIFTQLLTKLFELPPIEVLDVYRKVDCVQKGGEGFVVCGRIKLIKLID